MVNKDNVVSVWFGYFKNEADFNNFLDESYTEDGDQIDSPFQNHFGCEYYDIDKCERAFYPERMSLRTLVSKASYLDDFAQSLSLQDSEYNCVYLIYDYQYDRRIKHYIAEENVMYFFQAINYTK